MVCYDRSLLMDCYKSGKADLRHNTDRHLFSVASCASQCKFRHLRAQIKPYKHEASEPEKGIGGGTTTQIIIKELSLLVFINSNSFTVLIFKVEYELLYNISIIVIC